MGALFVLAFIGIPILEIIVFIQAGQWIGLWPTLAGVALTAVIGAALVRHQGLSTIVRAQQSVNAGRFPVAEVFDGLCLVLAGAFLITPGFVTDTLGFLLLIPSLRSVLRRTVGRHMLASGRVSVWSDGAPGGPSGPGGPPRRDRAGNAVIEGEYEDVSASAEGDPANTSSSHVPEDETRDNTRGGQKGSSPWRPD